jgi:hypothetical protein
MEMSLVTPLSSVKYEAGCPDESGKEQFGKKEEKTGH